MLPVVDRRKRVIFFLDYDGTLAPIVPHPPDAFIPEDTLQVVKNLCDCFETVIVTGRSLEAIRAFLGSGLPKIGFATSHGMRISLPIGFIRCPDACSITLGGAAESFSVQEDAIAGLQQLKRALEASELPEGTLIEDNEFCISVHYRHYKDDAKKVNLLNTRLEGILHKFLDIKHCYGKYVHELRANLDWNKGSAVKWILERLNVDEETCCPIYIGDDITDEDGFQAVNLYTNGISIKVAPDSNNTLARYTLPDTQAVKAFLLSFVP